MLHHTSIDSPPADTRQKWSVHMADSVLARHPVTSAKWHYEHGLMLLALTRGGPPAIRAPGAMCGT